MMDGWQRQLTSHSTVLHLWPLFHPLVALTTGVDRGESTFGSGVSSGHCSTPVARKCHDEVSRIYYARGVKIGENNFNVV
jgi:hypothetical protein